MSSLFIVTACYGYTWLSGAPYNGTVYYACVGDSVTIPWAVITSSTERVTDMEWYFRDNGMTELCGVSSVDGVLLFQCYVSMFLSTLLK